MIAVSLVGCGHSPKAPAATALPADCTSRQASRWAGPWSYVPAFVGDLGTDGAAGAAVADSTLFVYQRQLGEVWRLDLAGRRTGSFGREGRGPGEFFVRGFPRVLGEGRVSWLGVSGDTVAVLDGNEVRLFSRAGAYRGHTRALTDLLKAALPRSSRIRLVSDGLLMDLEQRIDLSRSRRPGPRPYGIWILGDSGYRRVFGMELPALPLLKNGAPHSSTREARPLWDLAGRCVVVSDGSSPWLLVAALDGTFEDTVPIPLPSRTMQVSQEEENLSRALGVTDDGSMQPALPRHVLDFSVDPDGWAWLRLVPPADGLERGVEVLRVPLGAGQPAFDTAPAFPAAFGPPGTFYGITQDPAGYRRLARFAAHPVR